MQEDQTPGTFNPAGAMPAHTHALFLVGRIVKGERRLVFVRRPPPAPIPGPWELRALFAG